MKTLFRALTLALTLSSVGLAADSKSGTTGTSPAKESARSHPLKGVVVAVETDSSALRVKHEEIPGVMRAMTMFFQVDAATLKAVKAGDAITGQMSRGDGMWRLTDVKVVPPQQK